MCVNLSCVAVWARRVAVLCCVWWSVSAWAQLPAPPEIAARSYLLMDVSAGQVLAQQQADVPVEPASLTKLMSAYIVFDALKSGKITLQQTFPVSQRAWKMPGSRMFIDPKMQVPVEDLLKGMIVQSGNDATIALAEGVAGSVERFVQLMNDQAQALGMRHTAYKNPEGLTEPGHTTTAQDLAILSQRLLKDFPDYISYYSLKKYRYPGTPAANDSNRNLLLFRDPSVDGLKTGHTQAAGYCLIATAKRDMPGLTGRRLLSIVLGATSESARAIESQKLLNWGFQNFETHKVYTKGQVVLTPTVWKGAINQLKLGFNRDVYVTLPNGSRPKITTQIERTDPLVAPINQYAPVGSLKLLANDQIINSVPLLALEPVPTASIVGRSIDTLRLLLPH